MSAIPLSSAMAGRPLSAKQRGILGGLYSKAYKRAVEHFATDDLDAKAWRHAQCRRVAGVEISEARQCDYLRLRRYGEDLCGNSGKAFATALAEPEEEVRQMRALVNAAIARWSDWGMSCAYAAVIARDKFCQKPLEQLSPGELEQLLYTINNRGKVMQERAEGGVSDGANRNKSQRRRGAATPAAPAPDDGAGERRQWPAPMLPVRDPADAA